MQPMSGPMTSIPSSGLFRSALLASCVAAFTLLSFTIPTANGAPIALSTPAGLSPGDTFRFLYTTSATRDATSSDIDTYNLFVNTDAGGATYGGQAVSWKALASTPSVSARDNVGGFGTSVPTYTTLGALVAVNLTTENGVGLWGSVTAPPIVGLDGSAAVTQGRVWTGTVADGTNTAFPLGGTSLPFANFGLPDSETPNWITSSVASQSAVYSLYAMSEDLTVAPIPEPSTYAMALAGLGFAVCALLRRRKQV